MKDLSEYPTIRVGTVDLNGRWRGKRMPGTSASKVAKGGVRLPLSVQNLDITGADIEDSPLVFASGDADGVALPTGRGPVPMPWLLGETALEPVALHYDDGTPFPGDPRHALARVLARYDARGWKVVAALELEFYLVTRTDTGIAPVNRPDGQPLTGTEVLSLDDLDAFDAFFGDLYDGAKAMGLAADTAISEGGTGQFEVNLVHNDAMRAADDAQLFKTLVKGLAARHIMTATFMAKPFADQAGNGAHVHFSVVDPYDKNVFDNAGPEGSATLHQAIAGSLQGLGELGLLFMPHGVSFDRLVDGAHAPTGIGWGYENRTAAIRIPGGPPTARRIEHRVAGGDTCPYLMLAGILGSALEGVEQAMTAPPPITGNAYEADLAQMPGNWDAAIGAFETSPLAASIFDPMLIDNLVRSKRQEQAINTDLSAQDRLLMYLERA